MDGLAVDARTGLTYRVGSYDLHTISEMRRHYGKLNITPGSVVLDAGACFGSFTMIALNAGAKVVAYEPDPDSFSLLKLNCPMADCRNAALVTDGSMFVDLYWTGSKNYASHSITVKRGRKVRAVVPAADFQTVLDEVKPNVLKVDVEGAEYMLLVEPLPEYVKQLAVELHNGRNRPALVASLAAQFATVVVVPRVWTKAWGMIGVYSR